VITHTHTKKIRNQVATGCLGVINLKSADLMTMLQGRITLVASFSFVFLFLENSGHYKII